MNKFIKKLGGILLLLLTILCFIIQEFFGGPIGEVGTETMRNTSIGKKYLPQDSADALSDYQKLHMKEAKLRKELLKLQEKVRQHPDKKEFKEELNDVQQQWKDAKANTENFKQNVLELAEIFKSITTDSERLHQANNYFQQSQFDKAREVLNNETLQSEQTQLLARKESLKEQTEENKKLLARNAQEWLLKAYLTAIDYSLKEQRIPQARSAFEAALKADNSANNLLFYGNFLLVNRQDHEAEYYFRQALDVYQKQAASMPSNENQANIASTLDNLAIIASNNTKRQNEAERLFNKALNIRRKLSKQDKLQYAKYVAITLNNLALLIAQDPKRRNEAEDLHQEALGIRLWLDEQYPNTFKKDIAITLNNWAMLVKQNPNRYKEAEILYADSLNIFRELTKSNPEFEQHVANTTRNLANLVLDNPKRQKEAETLYQQALKIYRKLADNNPEVFQPELARTLFHFGNAYINGQQPARAKPLLEEANTLLIPYVADEPERFKELQQDIQNLLNKLP